MRRLRPTSASDELCIVRPGGIGDVVILLKAVLDLGVDPRSVGWFVEKRNAVWLDYLDVPFRCYDDANTFCAAIRGDYSCRKVVNTEQTFGLSTLFSMRLSGAGGQLFGFSRNRRSDLYSSVVFYQTDQSEHICFKELLSAAMQGGSYSSADCFKLPDSQAPETHPYQVIAIAGQQVEYKRMSIHWWLEFIEYAHKDELTTYLVGSPKDLLFASELAKRSKKPVRNLVGEINFSSSVSYVRHADRLYSVDSGLVHIADFFSVPSTVVFPGGNYKKWRPLNEDSLVLDINYQKLDGVRAL
jgi:hypothetical protein